MGRTDVRLDRFLLARLINKWRHLGWRGHRLHRLASYRRECTGGQHPQNEPARDLEGRPWCHDLLNGLEGEMRLAQMEPAQRRRAPRQAAELNPLLPRRLQERDVEKVHLHRLPFYNSVASPHAKSHHDVHH